LKTALILRYRADSNRCSRFCRPVPSLSATIPCKEFANLDILVEFTKNNLLGLYSAFINWFIPVLIEILQICLNNFHTNNHYNVMKYRLCFRHLLYISYTSNLCCVNIQILFYMKDRFFVLFPCYLLKKMRTEVLIL
jgi:hypothetical protein